jgi:hypothetical protein
MTTEDWLNSNGFSAHTETFVQQAIAVEMLASLRDKDLETLGLTTLGERRRFITLAARLDPMWSLKRHGLRLMLVLLGFWAYCGMAWFFWDFSIASAPLKLVKPVSNAWGEPVFCTLAIIGGLAFPPYLVMYIKVLSRRYP